MNFSEHVDQKIDTKAKARQIDKMRSRQQTLKKRRIISKSAIHTGETFLLASAVSFPFGGWSLVLTLLGLGVITYGAARLIDKKIVNEYNGLDNKIALASKELSEQNYKAMQKEKEANKTPQKSNFKSKAAQTTATIDETKEA